MIQQSAISVMAVQLVESVLKQGGKLSNENAMVEVHDVGFYKVVDYKSEWDSYTDDVLVAAKRYVELSDPVIAVGDAIKWMRERRKSSDASA